MKNNVKKFSNIIKNTLVNDFVSVVRLLNRFDCFDDKSLESICFIPSLNPLFPENEIEEIRINSSGKVEIVVNFLPIVGPMGIMPLHYTEYMILRSREKNYDLLDFITILYDKIIKFFAIIVNSDIHLDYENYLHSSTQSPPKLWDIIANLMGLNINILAEGYANSLFFKFSSSLITRSRSAKTLQFILGQYLKFPVEIKQFVPEIEKLPEPELSKLGQANNQLSTSLYLGDNAYFCQNKVQIIISEMDFASYQRILEDNYILPAIKQFIDFFLGHEIRYDLFFLVTESEKATILSYTKPRKLGVSLWCKI